MHCIDKIRTLKNASRLRLTVVKHNQNINARNSYSSDRFAYALAA